MVLHSAKAFSYAPRGPFLRSPLAATRYPRFPCVRKCRWSALKSVVRGNGGRFEVAQRSPYLLLCVNSLDSHGLDKQ